MSRAGAELVEIARSAAVISESSFALGGATHQAPSREGKPQLLEELCNALYGHYSRRPARGRAPVAPANSRRFLLRLSSANSGNGTWEPGWRVAGREEDGRVKVTRDGLTLWAQPEQIAPLTAEGMVRLRVGKERRAMVPGFYLAIGDAAEPEKAPAVITRLYWHLAPGGAERAVALVTTTLNRRAVPFHFKVVSDPGSYGRADSAVLYLDRAHFQRERDALAAAEAELRPVLLAGVPRLVKQLGHGTGLAEDPRSHESFGEHRCRLIGAALWQAFREGRASPDDRVAAVWARFAAEGLDPDRPYLATGSTDDYGPEAER